MSKQKWCLHQADCKWLSGFACLAYRCGEDQPKCPYGSKQEREWAPYQCLSYEPLLAQLLED